MDDCNSLWIASHIHLAKTEELTMGADSPKPQPQPQQNLSFDLGVVVAEGTAAGGMYEWVTGQCYMRR